MQSGDDSDTQHGEHHPDDDPGCEIAFMLLMQLTKIAALP